MRWFTTCKLLWQFLARPIRGGNHAERLESFYGYQSHVYDEFRKPFLRGRDELAARLPFTPGSRWCDLGCGTGYMLEASSPRSRACTQIELVDLCPSLLKVAQEKVVEQAWCNVRTSIADITQFQPESPVDLVTFSYSLSMTPDWFTAIDQAVKMLRSGGLIGVVDFYTARKYPISDTHRKHYPWTRHFWPAWFDTDNVHPSPDHIPYLYRKFSIQWFFESRTRVPGMPWLRPPYYCLIGRAY